jgi:hypothetical protein
LTDGKGKAARSPKKAAKRTMSAKGWAKVKKPTKSRAERILSPEAKAKISAAQKMGATEEGREAVDDVCSFPYDVLTGVSPHLHVH